MKRESFYTVNPEGLVNAMTFAFQVLLKHPNPQSNPQFPDHKFHEPDWMHYVPIQVTPMSGTLITGSSGDTAGHLHERVTQGVKVTTQYCPNQPKPDSNPDLTPNLNLSLIPNLLD